MERVVFFDVAVVVAADPVDASPVLLRVEHAPVGVEEVRGCSCDRGRLNHDSVLALRGRRARRGGFGNLGEDGVRRIEAGVRVERQRAVPVFKRLAPQLVREAGQALLLRDGRDGARPSRCRLRRHLTSPVTRFSVLRFHGSYYTTLRDTVVAKFEIRPSRI